MFIQQAKLIVAEVPPLLLMYDTYNRASHAANNSCSSSRTHEAWVSIAVSSACVGLTLEPVVHALDLSCVSWFRTHNLKTKHLQPGMCPSKG